MTLVKSHWTTHLICFLLYVNYQVDFKVKVKLSKKLKGSSVFVGSICQLVGFAVR